MLSAFFKKKDTQDASQAEGPAPAPIAVSDVTITITTPRGSKLFSDTKSDFLQVPASHDVGTPPAQERKSYKGPGQG